MIIKDRGLPPCLAITTLLVALILTLTNTTHADGYVNPPDPPYPFGIEEDFQERKIEDQLSTEELRAVLQKRELKEQLEQQNLQWLRMKFQERQLLLQLIDQEKHSANFTSSGNLPSKAYAYMLPFGIAILLLAWCLVYEASYYLQRQTPDQIQAAAPGMLAPFVASAMVLIVCFATGFSFLQPQETAIVLLAASLPPGSIALLRIVQSFLGKLFTDQGRQREAAPLIFNLPDGQSARVEDLLEGARAYSQLPDERKGLEPMIRADPQTGTEFKFTLVDPFKITIVEPHLQTGGNMRDTYHVNESPGATAGHGNIVEGNVNIAKYGEGRQTQLELLDQLIRKVRASSGDDAARQIAERNLECVRDEIAVEQNPDGGRISKWLGRAKDAFTTLDKGGEFIRKAQEIFELVNTP